MYMYTCSLELDDRVTHHTFYLTDETINWDSILLITPTLKSWYAN